MDKKLVGWARAVKSRMRAAGRPFVPPLWLFTDGGRMPDPVAAVRRLPHGLCGVVFRHDGVPGRAKMIQAVWQVCRSRRLTMVVAGNAWVPAGVGRHMRGGRGPCGAGFCTASAHAVAEVRRAGRNGARAVFLSPVFATASHPGARSMGPWRFGAVACRAGLPVLALGGITGGTVLRLPRWVAGIGAIGALAGD
jgi:thiamine-phosphate pyrophosphorylase